MNLDYKIILTSNIVEKWKAIILQWLNKKYIIMKYYILYNGETIIWNLETKIGTFSSENITSNLETKIKSFWTKIYHTYKTWSKKIKTERILEKIECKKKYKR